MAHFEVRVYRVDILPHPDADAIELARIGDYLSIVRKGQFVTNDLVAYIPEQSVLPDRLIEELGLTGRLAGSKHNRVKAIKLRGVLSQGLVYPAKESWIEGQDVKEDMGIVKWIPPIPTSLAGEVQVGPRFSFDIENIKKHPTVFKDGEEVIFTEKIHGSCMLTCWTSEEESHPEMINGKLLVTSKGLADQHLFLKDNENNKGNSYLKCAKDLDLYSKYKAFFTTEKSVWILGELFGMQDLKYGAEGGHLQFRVFGIKEGDRWLDWVQMEAYCAGLGLPTVPVLYRGPFSKEMVALHTAGKETVSGKEKHIREGIVIYPIEERYLPELGRVFLKSVSDAYHLRKEGTEFT